MRPRRSIPLVMNYTVYIDVDAVLYLVLPLYPDFK